MHPRRSHKKIQNSNSYNAVKAKVGKAFLKSHLQFLVLRSVLTASLSTLGAGMVLHNGLPLMILETARISQSSELNEEADLMPKIKS